jgi:hypothetical protein
LRGAVVWASAGRTAAISAITLTSPVETMDLNDIATPPAAPGKDTALSLQL